MGLSDLSSTAAVLSAIEEFDRLGQEQFLELYGFAAATEYLSLFKGRKYDSKAIAGVAHKYQFARCPRVAWNVKATVFNAMCVTPASQFTLKSQEVLWFREFIAGEPVSRILCGVAPRKARCKPRQSFL